MSRVRIVAPLVAVYWIVLLLGLTLFAVDRQNEPLIVGPLWGGAIFGTLVGHVLGLLGLRLWFTIVTAGMFVLLGYDGNLFWMAFAPATLFAAISVGDRWSLAAFWFPAVIWMLTILDGTDGKSTPDGTAAVLLGVLAIAFVVFLRARESRRVGLWQTVAAAPIATGRTATVLKEHPGKELGRSGWSLMVSAAAFGFTAWLAPHLWDLETFGGDTVKVAGNDSRGNGVVGGAHQLPPCCEDLLETQRSRVKEYFDFGRGRDKLSGKKEQDCRKCGAGGGNRAERWAPSVDHWDRWEHPRIPDVVPGDIVAGGGMGNGGMGGDSGGGGGGGGGSIGGGGTGGGGGAGGRGTGGGGAIELERDWSPEAHPTDPIPLPRESTMLPREPYYQPPRYQPPRYQPPRYQPPRYQPPRHEPKIEPKHEPKVEPKIEPKVEPKIERAPEVKQPEVKPQPPVVAQAPEVLKPESPSIAQVTPESPPTTSTVPSKSDQPAPAINRAHPPSPVSTGSEILRWLTALVAAVLALQIFRFLFRPLRRAIALRHLRKPFWEETIDQRVSNWWQLVLVGLRDAGWRTSSSEQPREFARRVGIDGVEQCAAILDRTRHGIRVDGSDLEEMGRSAEAAYRSARSGTGVLARTGAQLRWPLA